MPLSKTSLLAIQQAQYHMPLPRAGLLFALRMVQAECGQVGSDEVKTLSELFSISPVQIEGVARFYDLLTETRVGAHRFRLCEGVVCDMRQAGAVWDAAAEAATGNKIPEETVTFERSACLGHCDHAPAALWDDRLVGPLNPTDVLELLQNALRGSVGDD